MRRLVAAGGLILALNLISATEASADVFNLNDIYCDCLPAGSTDGGTVTLTQQGGDIRFEVNLNDLLNFHYSNAFDLFAFNYSGTFAESSFSISGQPAGWSLFTSATGAGSMDGAGHNYDLFIDCASCGPGGGGISGVNVLTFVLHSSLGALDLASFETVNGDGGANNNNFAASVTQLGANSCTGVIGGGFNTGQSVPQASSGGNDAGQSCGTTFVPDGGATLGLLGMGLLGLGYLRRRNF